MQATGHDQAVGWAMVSLSSFLFVYYTVWVIVLVSQQATVIYLHAYTWHIVSTDIHTNTEHSIHRHTLTQYVIATDTHKHSA